MVEAAQVEGHKVGQHFSVEHIERFVRLNVPFLGSDDVPPHQQPSCFRNYIKSLRRGTVSSVPVDASHFVPMCVRSRALSASLPTDSAVEAEVLCAQMHT